MNHVRDNRLVYTAIGALSGFTPIGFIPALVFGFMARSKEEEIAQMEGRPPKHDFMHHPVVIVLSSLISFGLIAAPYYGYTYAQAETRADLTSLHKQTQWMQAMQEASLSGGIAPQRMPQMAMPQQQGTYWQDAVTEERMRNAMASGLPQRQ